MNGWIRFWLRTSKKKSGCITFEKQIPLKLHIYYLEFRDVQGIKKLSFEFPRKSRLRIDELYELYIPHRVTINSCCTSLRICRKFKRKQIQETLHVIYIIQVKIEISETTSTSKDKNQLSSSQVFETLGKRNTSRFELRFEAIVNTVEAKFRAV